MQDQWIFTIFEKRFICYLLIYLIYFWLCRVLVAACGILVEACRIFCCDVQAPRCGVWPSLLLWCAGFSLLSLRRAGSRVRGLCSCGSRAQLPHSMWDLSSPTRDQTCVPHITRWTLHHWTTREVPDFYCF